MNSGGNQKHQDEQWISNPRAGALNLLTDCIGIKEGETLLLVREDSRHGQYDAAAGNMVATVAEELGAEVFQIYTPPIFGPEDFPEMLGAALQHADHAVFFSRIGDQIRFSPYTSKQTATMCYALDIDLLGSPFCTLPHSLIKTVATKLEERLALGGDWHVTCPLGTDITGHLDPRAMSEKDQNAFSVFLFPLGILPPMPAATMSGNVATKWISSTQNHQYEPEGMVFDEQVHLKIKEGSITEITGRDDLAQQARDHYDYVARLFDIDRNFIHSWHTGHHPKTNYQGDVKDNMTRWGTVAFNSPRYMHIHTCGTYPPGEIALIVIDATIALDGETLWKDGTFSFLERPEIKALLDDYPGHENAFDMLRNIGV